MSSHMGTNTMSPSELRGYTEQQLLMRAHNKFFRLPQILTRFFFGETNSDDSHLTFISKCSKLATEFATKSAAECNQSHKKVLQIMVSWPNLLSLTHPFQQRPSNFLRNKRGKGQNRTSVDDLVMSLNIICFEDHKNFLFHVRTISAQ